MHPSHSAWSQGRSRLRLGTTLLHAPNSETLPVLIIPPNKNPRSRGGFLLAVLLGARKPDQKSIPPMPPMPPPGGIIGSSFFGASATIASVVIIRPAIDAAFCSAMQTLDLRRSPPRGLRGVIPSRRPGRTHPPGSDWALRMISSSAA